MEHELPDGWEWGKLGDVSNIVMGQSPPGDTYNETGDGTPFLQGKSEFCDVSPKHVKYTTCPNKIAPEGSVLISVRAPVGDVNVASIDYCIGRGLASVSLKDGSNKYLFYVLRYLKPKLESQGTGSTFMAISKPTLSNLVIPLPPLDVQQKIVSILEKAEETKRLRAQADELTQQLLKNVFLEMFGDPVKNEKGWEMTTLGDMCTLIKDGPHVSPKYVEKGVPFITVNNIINGYFDFSNPRYISEEDHKLFCKRCRPEKGDVLYTKGGTTGFAKRIDIDIEFSIWVHLALLKFPKDSLDSIFLENCLNSDYCKAQAERYTRGIANKDLVLSQIAKISIPIPPLPLQQKFAAIVGHTERIREHQTQSSQEINILFDSLMQKAFTGELIC